MNYNQSDLFKAVLRPIVRIALLRSDRLQDIVDILKELFVEEAQTLLEGKVKRKTVSISQISLTSGVHRIDTARFIKAKEAPQRRAPTLMSRVLSTWENDSRYTTRSGSPRVLPLDGEEVSFRSLLNEVSPQLSTSGVLLELERTGAVETTPRGVRLKKAIHFAGSDQNVRIELLASNIDTLLRAALDNLEAKVKPFHAHYRTEYDRVYASKMPKIRQWVQDETKKFHSKLRKFISKYDADTSPQTTQGRSKREEEECCRYTLVSVGYSDCTSDEKK